MKKRVLFDFGNVLYYIYPEEWNNYLINNEYLEPQNVKNFTEVMCNVFDIGLCTFEQFFNINGVFGSEVDRLLDLWMAKIQPCKPMIDLVNELLENKFEVCLLSNIGKEHAEIIKNDPVLKRCRHFFSYEIGARKPHALYFQYVSSALNICSESVVNYGFYDDREDNIKGAKNFLYSPHQFNLHDFSTGEDAAKYMKEELLGLG